MKTEYRIRIVPLGIGLIFAKDPPTYYWDKWHMIIDPWYVTSYHCGGLYTSNMWMSLKLWLKNAWRKVWPWARIKDLIEWRDFWETESERHAALVLFYQKLYDRTRFHLARALKESGLSSESSCQSCMHWNLFSTDKWAACFRVQDAMSEQEAVELETLVYLAWRSGRLKTHATFCCLHFEHKSSLKG